MLFTSCCLALFGILSKISVWMSYMAQRGKLPQMRQRAWHSTSTTPMWSSRVSLLI